MISITFVTVVRILLDTKVRLGFFWWLSFHCFDLSGFYGQLLFNMITFFLHQFSSLCAPPPPPLLLIKARYHSSWTFWRYFSSPYLRWFSVAVCCRDEMSPSNVFFALVIMHALVDYL